MKLIENIENNVPTNDIIFQLLFGRNKNKHLTDNFIKSTLKFINDDTNLNNIRINSEVSLEKIKIKDKSIRLDILAEYEEKIVCIEMQNKNLGDIYERARFYASKVEAHNLSKSEKYTDLKPLTMIIILNYVPENLKDTKILQNLITIDDFNNNRDINWGLKYIFIFLPKLKEVRNENLNNDFFKWLKFIEYKDMEVIEHMAKENKFIKDAQNEMFVLTAEQEEKNWQRFRENYLIERKFDRAEFFKEGEKSGEKKGKELGRKLGRNEGRKEGIRDTIINFAKKMLAEKYSIQEIINLTGLSEKEINKLAENN